MGVGAPPREVGSGVFEYGRELGAIAGSAGALRRYQVAVEDGSGEDADRFGEAVDAVLSDRRSWIGIGRLRLQRVPAGAASDFTVYLATPATSDATKQVVKVSSQYSTAPTLDPAVVPTPEPKRILPIFR